LEFDMARLAPFSALVLLALAGGCHKQAPPAPQAEATPASAPAPTGPVADTSNAGKGAPDAEIKDADGKPAKLTDRKGKPLLVNLWATWCVPCVKELPTLDALAAQNPNLQVVAVSEDLQGRPAVDAFLAKHPLKTLKPWADAGNALTVPLKVAALPTTILYDAKGKEVWRVTRDLDWTSAQAKALIAQAG
jgi:thiol-disulfide isomerase/thioredoxin